LKKIILLSHLLVAVIVLVSCGAGPEYLRSLHNDYTTPGFLNPDLYQAVITGTPDENVRGLVARRESARMNALPRVKEHVIRELYTEWKTSRGSHLEGIPEENYRKDVMGKLADFVDRGCVVEKYYNRDHSISVVYRIHAGNLRDKIFSIQVPGEPTGKGEDKDATSS